MKQITKKLSDLKSDFNNIRNHSDNQIDELLKSVKKYGQTRAIVTDENNQILIGKGLYLAMVKGGYDTAECYEIKDLSDIEKKKLMLSDNKIFQLGYDNYNAIDEILKDLAVKHDFDLIGYDEEVIRNLALSENELKKSLVKAEVVNHEIEPRVKVTTSDIQDNNNNYTDEEVEENIYQEPKGTDDSNVDVDYVICPKCGEKIYIK